MSGPTIQVDGLRELRRDFKRLDPAIDKELGSEIRKAAVTALNEARANAPRLTGELARSLRVSVTARGASIYSRLPYAGVLHWGGTIQPRGVPITFPRTEFVSRAVESGAARLVDDIGDGIERVARRIGWHT